MGWFGGDWVVLRGLEVVSRGVKYPHYVCIEANKYITDPLTRVDLECMALRHFAGPYFLVELISRPLWFWEMSRGDEVALKSYSCSV